MKTATPQQRITVALVADMVAHDALKFAKADPAMWTLYMKQLLNDLGRLTDAMYGKDVTK